MELVANRNKNIVRTEYRGKVDKLRSLKSLKMNCNFEKVHAQFPLNDTEVINFGGLALNINLMAFWSAIFKL